MSTSSRKFRELLPEADQLSAIEWYRVIRDYSFAENYESREWLDFIVRNRVCVACGRPASDPHHIFSGTFGAGTSDAFAVPVCRECHSKHQDTPQFKVYCMFIWMLIINEALLNGDIGPLRLREPGQS